MDGLFIRAAFARAPGLRASHVGALLGAAEGELTRCLEPQRLARVRLPPRALAWLRFPDTSELDSDLRWLARSGAHLLTSTDPEYPQQLRQLADAPAALFVLGDVQKLATPQLAMVGSRGATTSGSDTAFRFAAQLARAGLTITSGLATGIDAASHRGALSVEQGITIAVCGTGLDAVYPIQHEELAARIRHRGALVSELAPRTPPRQANFPQRIRRGGGRARAARGGE